MEVYCMAACRMRDCWMAPTFKRRCCIRACSRSILSERRMNFSMRKTGQFLSHDILRDAISPISVTALSAALRKVLQRNPFGVICTTSRWKLNLNKERGTQIILLNFISNSRLTSHVLCRHSYSRFYCASRGARGGGASRTRGGDCGRPAAIMERGGGQSSRGANG